MNAVKVTEPSVDDPDDKKRATQAHLLMGRVRTQPRKIIFVALVLAVVVVVVLNMNFTITAPTIHRKSKRRPKDGQMDDDAVVTGKQLTQLQKQEQVAPDRCPERGRGGPEGGGGGAGGVEGMGGGGGCLPEGVWCGGRSGRARCKLQEHLGPLPVIIAPIKRPQGKTKHCAEVLGKYSQPEKKTPGKAEGALATPGFLGLCGLFGGVHLGTVHRCWTAHSGRGARAVQHRPRALCRALPGPCSERRAHGIVRRR